MELQSCLRDKGRADMLVHSI